MRKSALPILSVVLYIFAVISLVLTLASVYDIVVVQIGTPLTNGYLSLRNDFSQISGYLSQSLMTPLAASLLLFAAARILQYVASLQDSAIEKQNGSYIAPVMPARPEVRTESAEGDTNDNE